jgi:Domain of unknown function (DUF4276)
MSNILTIAYTTEGTTDERFLKNIIAKVFEELCFECETDIEVYEPMYLKFPKELGFVDDVKTLSVKAYESGINVLCIHTDADHSNDKEVLTFKINPALEGVNEISGIKKCSNIVILVPVHMTEAWMLADKDLLREEIGTNLSLTDLGINRHPESIANPKKIIEEALVLAQTSLPKRRNKVEISDLYQPLGQKIKMESLEKLESFKKFKKSAENALIKLNYLHTI